jgi:hypothetical protein
MSRSSFSIDRFVEQSKPVETRDLDWNEIARIGISADEARVLRYMSGVENHIILSLRDMLVGPTARDAEVTSFMSCWVYEELHHGRAIERVLAVCGHGAADATASERRAPTPLAVELETFFAGLLPRLVPHFAALHMAWGALDELLAASAYTQLAAYTRNRELARLLLRMAKDERRHHAFFFSQARRRLQHPLARLIVEHGLPRLWIPFLVGARAGGGDELAFTGWLLYSDRRGEEELMQIDRQMARLPGLEFCDLAHRRVTRRMDVFGQRHPEQLMQLRTARDARASDHDSRPEPMDNESYAEAR